MCERGVGSYSHGEKTGDESHAPRDRAGEVSSSVTTTVQSPATVDPSLLNHIHVVDPLHDPTVANNPVASTMTPSHLGRASFSSLSLVVKSLGYDTANARVGQRCRYTSYGIWWILKTAAGLTGPVTAEDDHRLYDVLRGCRRMVVIGVHSGSEVRCSFIMLTQFCGT